MGMGTVMRVRPCALIRRDDSILVLRYDYPGGLVHAVPGGTIEPGETISQCLVREFQEELSIVIRPQELLYVGDMLPVGTLKQTIHLVFEAELISGEPVINPNETSAECCLWLACDRLAEVNLYPAINNELVSDSKKQAGGKNARYIGNCQARQWA